MRIKLTKIKNMFERILRGEFPRKLGEMDMLAECVSRVRALAVIVSIEGNASEVNHFFDQAEALDAIAYGDFARAISRRQMRCSASLAPAFMKVFESEVR